MLNICIFNIINVHSYINYMKARIWPIFRLAFSSIRHTYSTYVCLGIGVCIAGSLILIMPKYMSVTQSVPPSACLPGCLLVRPSTSCHPVWSAARPCQNFHLQSTRPPRSHTHTEYDFGVHTIFKLGKAPFPAPNTQPSALSPSSCHSFHLTSRNQSSDCHSCLCQRLHMCTRYVCVCVLVCGGIF